MWNDSIHRGAGMFQCVRKTLAAERRISRDVVQVPWDYGKVRGYAVERIKDMRRQGFRVWIAPGSTAETARAWHQVAIDNDCEGLLSTSWTPVCKANRDRLLQVIRNTMPFLSARSAPGQVAIPLATYQRVSVAPARNGHVHRPPTQILAPNRLGQTLQTTPYLIPSDFYLRNWHVLGPFPFARTQFREPQQQDVINTSFIDHEAELVAQAEGTSQANVTWRSWKPSPRNDIPHVVDFSQMYNGLEYAAAYAVAHIHSAKDAKGLRMYFGSDDYIQVWLNQQLIHSYNEKGRAIVQDNDVVEGIVLRQGWNTLVIKCININGGWGLTARIANQHDKPFATDIRAET